MIFVTVGTHEQPFNRLLENVDSLVADGIIKEKVMMQTGYSTYVPKHCEWKKMFSYEEMHSTINEARIVITHGGPASFIEVLQTGKTPIVVPRLEKFGEHVNNHQAEFVKVVSKRMNNIIPIMDISQLKDAILNFDQLSRQKKGTSIGNNKKFNMGLDKIVDDLFPHSDH